MIRMLLLIDHKCALTMHTTRYRTPLCIFFPPHIIAAACFILAQRVAEGPHSPSLDARISVSPASASLPTPPPHKPGSPDASRFVIDYFGFSESELQDLSGQYAIPRFESGSLGFDGLDALCIMLEFYSAQDPQATLHVSPLTTVSSRHNRPTHCLNWSRSPHQLTPRGRNCMSHSRSCCPQCL